LGNLLLHAAKRLMGRGRSWPLKGGNPPLSREKACHLCVDGGKKTLGEEGEGKPQYFSNQEEKQYSIWKEKEYPVHGRRGGRPCRTPSGGEKQTRDEKGKQALLAILSRGKGGGNASLGGGESCPAAPRRGGDLCSVVGRGGKEKRVCRLLCLEKERGAPGTSFS